MLLFCPAFVSDEPHTRGPEGHAALHSNICKHAKQCKPAEAAITQAFRRQHNHDRQRQTVQPTMHARATGTRRSYRAVQTRSLTHARTSLLHTQ